MIGILVFIEGLGDIIYPQFGGKTPLEIANTPNLDFFASRGELGYMFPVKPGYLPESHEPLVSIFNQGNLLGTRGVFEAFGSEINLMRGDLALRVNFATLDNLTNKNVVDRRVGRTLTYKEAEILARDINKIDLPVKFFFKHTLWHRGILVLKGGFSDSFFGNDGSINNGIKKEIVKYGYCKGFDESENTLYSVNILNEFIDKSLKVLFNHPINLERRRKGLLEANCLLVRGPGCEIPKLNKYRRWCSVCYSPETRGFSKISGMMNFDFDYPKNFSVDSYSNFYEGLEKASINALKMIKKNSKKYDYALVNFKEVEIPGYDNKIIEKKKMIEFLDANFFKELREIVTLKNISLVVTSNYCCVCKVKSPTTDFVPILFYKGGGIPKSKIFCEKSARIGNLGQVQSKDFLKIVGMSF